MKNKWRQKKVANRFIILYDGDYEVSVHLNKEKGLIKRKSYSSFVSAIRAYKNINSVKAIKSFVGDDWEQEYLEALGSEEIEKKQIVTVKKLKYADFWNVKKDNY